MMKQLAVAGALVLGSPGAAAEIVRKSFTASSDAGIEIAIREVTAPGVRRIGDPVLLLHGARVSGVPSFDLDVEGGSLAADLAQIGFAVYIVDLRGYGASTRPPAMAQPPQPNSALVRSGEAVRDLGAAVDAVRARTGAEQIAILGWATGGHWAGMYATVDPTKVSRIVFYNTLYGYSPEHAGLGRGTGMADPDHPDRFDIGRFGSYRFNTAESLLPSWDQFIPAEDKSTWRDPVLVEAYAEAALASDPTSGDRDPPSFRAPTGALADSFLLATGAALWDARLIEADALIVRSGRDFWSREEDAETLRAHLEARDEGTVRMLALPDATHYLHLERPERGRKDFLDAVIRFLVEERRPS